MQAPWLTQAETPSTQPKQWKSGTGRQTRGDFRKQMGWLMVWSAVYALVYFFFIDKVYALVQLGTALAIPLLRCYDGTRGKWRGMGWLFYVYYPAHLALIGVLRVLLWGAGASTAAGSF